MIPALDIDPFQCAARKAAWIEIVGAPKRLCNNIRQTLASPPVRMLAA